MIMEVLGHKDYLRLLLALERKPLRFTEIQKRLNLNPAQVNRALTLLRKGLWVIPRTIPSSKGRIKVQYILGKRGIAFLESFKSFRTAAEKRETEIGRSEVAELEGLFR